MAQHVPVIPVGSRCFYKGEIYQVAGMLSSSTVTLYRDGWTAIAAPLRKVEPLASDIFKVGDQVQSSKIFTGVVTGFEPAENRVICMSDATPVYTDQRLRYAYKPWEIHPMIGYQLEEGNMHCLIMANGQRINVKVCKHPVPEYVVLVDDDKIGYSIPRNVKMSDLKELGISRIVAAKRLAEV